MPSIFFSRTGPIEKHPFAQLGLPSPPIVGRVLAFPRAMPLLLAGQRALPPKWGLLQKSCIGPAPNVVYDRGLMVWASPAFLRLPGAILCAVGPTLSGAGGRMTAKASAGPIRARESGTAVSSIDQYALVCSGSSTPVALCASSVSCPGTPANFDEPRVSVHVTLGTKFFGIFGETHFGSSMRLVSCT